MALELNVSKNTNEAIAGTYGKNYSQVASKIFTKASSGDDDDYDTGS